MLPNGQITTQVTEPPTTLDELLTSPAEWQRIIAIVIAKGPSAIDKFKAWQRGKQLTFIHGQELRKYERHTKRT